MRVNFTLTLSPHTKQKKIFFYLAQLHLEETFSIFSVIVLNHHSGLEVSLGKISHVRNEYEKQMD